MDKFIINGGNPLNGEVTPAGNKNSTLPLLAACLLTKEPVILHNVPDIRDVVAMKELLRSLGVKIKELGNKSLEIEASDIHPSDLDPNMCKQIRASILLAGPMIARAGKLELPPPGGDIIGRRRVDTHIIALEKLGTWAYRDKHPA